MTTLRILRLPHSEGLALPAYETPGSAGMDLRAAIGEDAPVMIEPGASPLVPLDTQGIPNGPITLLPGARVLAPTGLKIALEQGWEAQIRPRSGLALKHGISAPNTPGTIDSDYRGEVGVILINLGQEPFVIKRGERIAQMVIAPVAQATVAEVDSLDETARGAGGFGSTGR